MMAGFPLPGCHVARANRCRPVRDVAAKGSGAAKAADAWGRPGRLSSSASGLLTGKTATAAPRDAREAFCEVLPGLQGL